MHPSVRIDALPAEQRQSIARLRVRLNDWFANHPERVEDFQSITLFGSRAVGLADPELSDWDLYVIMKDDAADGPSPADDLILHDDCPTEWHRRSVAGHLAGLEWSSLDLSRAVEKYGVPLYGKVPDSPSHEFSGTVLNMNIEQFNAHLKGVVGVGVNIPTQVDGYLEGLAEGFPDRTRQNEPYDPDLFKYSSNFAEHVSKLIVAFRGVTPRSVHKLNELAEQLESSDPYRQRIADLNGATRDGNIAQYNQPPPPPDKAEDEPIERSTTRLVGAFSLLRDFLKEYANAIEPVTESDAVRRSFSLKVRRWRNSTVLRLEDVFKEAKSEEWIEQIARDASLVGSIFERLLERVQAASRKA